MRGSHLTDNMPNVVIEAIEFLDQLVWLTIRMVVANRTRGNSEAVDSVVSRRCAFVCGI